MRVKLYDALGQHLVTYAVWEKAFDRWLDESSEMFFVDGGYAEIWNDHEACRLLRNAAQSKPELRRCIRHLAC
ncbi:MAG: hypothetical protein WA970_10180 [Gammaproteobacteria bacterium]|nr:hypothetical protein [Gammaproteobacteria bacterium]